LYFFLPSLFTLFFFIISLVIPYRFFT